MPRGADGLAAVPGLQALWAKHVGAVAATDPRAIPLRLLLDTLGLGLSQTLRQLTQARSDFAGFLDWIEATAGAPDPARIERLVAWAERAPMPPAEAARQAMIDAMPPVLYAADLSHWDEHGYVVLRAALSPDEAAAAADLVWRTLDASPDDPASWVGRATEGVWVDIYQGAALEPLRRSLRVHKVFAQLWGHADLWGSIDRMGFTPPQGEGGHFQGQRLHWDTSLAPPVPFATQALAYLTDTPAERGALQVVPGFHHRLHDWLAGLDGVDPYSIDLSGEAVSVGGSAGDLVIWRQELPHGPGVNRSDRPRLTQYFTMYEADILFDDRPW